MKKVLLSIVITLFGVLIQAQDLPVQFKANEEANPWIGKLWDYSYETMKTPINITFDGENLKMIYEGGKVYFEKEIINFQYKENKKYDEVKDKVYILETKNEHNFTEYILIQITYSYGDVSYEIQLPYMDQKGIIMSYWRYQQF
jgi:hypothetical protein